MILRNPILLTLFLFLLLLSTTSADPTHKDGYDYYHEWAAKNLPGGEKDGVAEGVRGKLDEFVEGVKKAWEEENRAKEKKDVIDLGQSLHMLQNKFDTLRNSIFKQFIEGKDSGKKSGSGGGGVGEDKDLKEIEESTSKIVHKIIDQQNHVGQIQEDVNSLQRTVDALTGNLQRLEKDLLKTTKVLNKLDVNHEDMRNKADEHYDHVSSHGDNLEDIRLNESQGHSKFYYFIVLEMVALAAFAFIRKRNAKKNKFNKMG